MDTPYSDATIIAAQSIYAEKFIAPDGSNNWSKQGLLVKEGGSFDYLLKITNETAQEYTGLTVYDTLPQIGDRNVFATTDRGSEFDVRLREGITPPEGYTVFYTTSAEVYQKSMTEMVNTGIWTSSVSDYSAVTAFKIVADDETVLRGNSVFAVRIPVQATSALDEASMAMLQGKIPQDQTSGTATWLEANNSFGFITTESPSVKESNTLWARIPFAGFCVKKVDGISDSALSGARQFWILRCSCPNLPHRCRSFCCWQSAACWARRSSRQALSHSRAKISGFCSRCPSPAVRCCSPSCVWRIL